MPFLEFILSFFCWRVAITARQSIRFRSILFRKPDWFALRLNLILYRNVRGAPDLGERLGELITNVFKCIKFGTHQTSINPLPVAVTYLHYEHTYISCVLKSTSARPHRVTQVCRGLASTRICLQVLIDPKSDSSEENTYERHVWPTKKLGMVETTPRVLIKERQV